MNKDIKVVQPKVSKLAESGLIKLEPGLKNAKRPVVDFNKIVIEI
jgi:predicted transcriptional regulator